MSSSGEMDMSQYDDEKTFNPMRGGAISSVPATEGNVGTSTLIFSNTGSMSSSNSNTTQSNNNTNHQNSFQNMHFLPSPTSSPPSSGSDYQPPFKSGPNWNIGNSHHTLVMDHSHPSLMLPSHISQPTYTHSTHLGKNKWDRPDDNRITMPHHPRSNSSSSLPSFNPVTTLAPLPNSQKTHMDSFVPEKVTDFKHVIYNLLVDNHNFPDKFTFVQPCTIKEKGQTKCGFCFNEKENPDKKLPEMYALHIRKARLDLEDSSSVFIQDLYKYYLRACVELLSKYFEKLDKYTYLYEDIHLFIPNGTIEEAEQRMKSMKTRSRKKRMKMN